MAIATVLDVGSTKVTCLAAEPGNGEGVHVLAFSIAPCKGVKRGVVTDADATAEGISSAVAQVESKLGREVNDLYVSVNGGQIEGAIGRGLVPIHPRTRAVTREDVLQVLAHSRQVPMDSDREVLQAMPSEFIVDGQRGIHEPIGMPASRLEITTFTLTARVETLKLLDQAVALAAKRVGQFVAGPLASGMGVFSAADISQGGVCVDIGGGKTDIAIFSNGSLTYTACIPVGGGLVTSDIAHLIRTSVETAEALKLASGAASARGVPEADGVEVLQLGQIEPRPMQRKVLCEIIESRMREIGTLVKGCIEKSGHGSAVSGGVVLTGGGSLLPGTAELFGSILGGGAVRVGQPEGANGAGYTAAVGLARYAFDSFEDELTPASGGDWKSKVRSLWSLFGSKP